MKYLLIVIALLFVLLASAFDGAQTAKKDYFNRTPMYEAIKGDTLKMAWYEGGDNHKWNPSFPSVPWLGIWYADFWHTCKFGWIYAYAIAIATLSCGYWTGWKKRTLVFITVFILAQGVEGEGFRVFYGNVCRLEPKESILSILSDINPFINTH